MRTKPVCTPTSVSDRARYLRLCSAMDMISDTSEALRAYLAMTHQGHDPGVSYLTVFGALQVLYVQQDAAADLCDCLGYPRDVVRAGSQWVKLPDYAKLSEVRRLRAKSIGHPMNFHQGKGSPNASAFITRMSLSSAGFELRAIDHAGKRTTEHVNIPALVKAQLGILEVVLARALNEASADERKHREKFKEERLEQVFAGLGHPLEKLHDAVNDETFRPVGMYGVNAVRQTMRALQMKLHERNEPFRDGLAHIDRQLGGALSRLADFYEGRANDRELADILATFVGDRIDELRSWARSFDEDYAPRSSANRDDIMKEFERSIPLAPSPTSSTSTLATEAGDTVVHREIVKETDGPSVKNVSKDRTIQAKKKVRRRN